MRRRRRRSAGGGRHDVDRDDGDRAGRDPDDHAWSAASRRAARSGSPAGTGDTLRFAVVSDTADELHVHGYDVLQPLEPGERVEVEIPADLEGIFEAELHGSGELVARLVVEP